MTSNLIQNGFSTGEVSPSLFGRTDWAKYRLGASTMRNFFVNYRGGASSRAGLRYVLACKQAATASDTTPPRNIPFQFNINQGYMLEFGDEYMRIVSNGAYVVEDSSNITGATKATQIVVTDIAHGYDNGDWIYIQGMLGMTQLNGLAWIISDKTADSYKLKSLFGNYVNSTAFGTYISGGTSERVYTVDSPYAVEDLPYLKYTQSADTMSFTCVNQSTGTDYPAYDLIRNDIDDWEFIAVTFATSQVAPTSATATPHASTTLSTYYSYVVTAINDIGEESIASNIATCQNNDISVNAGSNVIAWVAAAGAVGYNIYAATPVYAVTTPSGVPFGYLGNTTGLSFVDTNIIADFTQTPPLATDPFPSTGNYPSVVAYYQQRRIYANTKNNPDTYYMSKPGAYANMDVSIPTIDSDAIVGTPWAQQINGIQFMLPMTTGLVTLTGNGAWLVNGGTAAITPSNQSATAQAYNGCNFHVQPLVINEDIIYVQAKGSVVRNLIFNFYTNIFTGEDKTVFSNHLFNFFQIQQWCYAEEPYKLVWGVRDDGAMLSMSYLKEQDVFGWSRHDTNGLFINVASITEPPVDAVYTIVKRYITGEEKWMYYQERMDNRNWATVEDSFCVDAGLSYPATYPNATLTPAAAEGTENISAINLIIGGSGYTSPTAVAIDPSGEGSGATFSVTISGGIITAINVLTQGSNYQPGTTISISDSVGSGAVAQPIITNIVSFTASSAVFSADNVGDVIRIGNNNISTASAFALRPNGGGKAIITSYISTTEVMADIIDIITNVFPDNNNDIPLPIYPNEWSVSTPTTVVTGLNHLEGMEVSILADGSVVPNQTIIDGSITLSSEASSITIGLPYICQLQTLYLEPQGLPNTAQGKRKNIQAVTVRMEASRGIQVGTNQVDQSTLPDNSIPTWVNMKEFKERNALINAGAEIPLYTGDERILVPGIWDKPGQVAIQQIFPLPCNVLAVIVEYSLGDQNG